MRSENVVICESFQKTWTRCNAQSSLAQKPLPQSSYHQLPKTSRSNLNCISIHRNHLLPFLLSTILLRRLIMPSLHPSSATMLRSTCLRQPRSAKHLQSLTPLRLISSSSNRQQADIVQRTSGEVDRTPSFNSPFRSRDSNPTTNIPSFKNYMSKRGETGNRVFQYFMVGSMGALAAAGAKATVEGMS